MTKDRALNKDIIKILSDGECDSPFSWFGAHYYEKGKSFHIAIRFFSPSAKEVYVIPKHGKIHQMNRYSKEGLFGIVLTRKRKPLSYIYHVIHKNGSSSKARDTYTFLPSISDYDLYLWSEGAHSNAYQFMGAHEIELEGCRGTHFTVWAPEAKLVSVIGHFNQWDMRTHIMRKHFPSGVWSLFIEGIKTGDLYKYAIKSKLGNWNQKIDPYAFALEHPPATASIVQTLKTNFIWNDSTWLKERAKKKWNTQPIAIYEVHLGSWMENSSSFGKKLTYRDIAEKLVTYVKKLNFTHIELMPISEFPYDPSWGYQVIGYFAPTCRFGQPDDLRYLINQCHCEGIGIILDWVPAHFPKDDHGLIRYDGSALYEHEDPKRGHHPDWDTAIFNYGRYEVKNFLISNALYWIQEFHIDGLRVDAVSSMLYLDYSRKEGEWTPNIYGERHNLEAISFLRQLNDIIHERNPGVITFAEESTAWDGVTRSTNYGGLGFDFKWNMGWMNDTLAYMKRPPIHRKFHQNDLTFSLVYGFSEKHILPLSHDEVVHGKGSLLNKMPGDIWQKMANLRLLYSYMIGHPGKKLLFMGSELGQHEEWSHHSHLPWDLLKEPLNQKLWNCVRDLLKLYQNKTALSLKDYHPDGFQWLDISDHTHSIISFTRQTAKKESTLIFICNFTPVVHHDYCIGVPYDGNCKVLLNTDDKNYGGSGIGKNHYKVCHKHWHNRAYSIFVTIPPLATIILDYQIIT